jgi:hypothetical protein
LAPDRLPGAGSAPILSAGYEGFTGRSWQELTNASPKTAEFVTPALPQSTSVSESRLRSWPRSGQRTHRFPYRPAELRRFVERRHY